MSWQIWNFESRQIMSYHIYYAWRIFLKIFGVHFDVVTLFGFLHRPFQVVRTWGVPLWPCQVTDLSIYISMYHPLNYEAFMGLCSGRNGKSYGSKFLFAGRTKKLYLVKKFLCPLDPFKVLFEGPKNGHLPNRIYQCWQVWQLDNFICHSNLFNSTSIEWIVIVDYSGGV